MSPTTRSTAKRETVTPYTRSSASKAKKTISAKKTSAPVIPSQAKRKLVKEGTQVIVTPSSTGKGVHTCWVYPSALSHFPTDKKSPIIISMSSLSSLSSFSSDSSSSSSSSRSSAAVPLPAAEPSVLARYATPSSQDETEVANRLAAAVNAPRKLQRSPAMRYDQATSQAYNYFPPSSPTPKPAFRRETIVPHSDSPGAKRKRQEALREEERRIFYEQWAIMMPGIDLEEWRKEKDVEEAARVQRRRERDDMDNFYPLSGLEVPKPLKRQETEIWIGK